MNKLIYWMGILSAVLLASCYEDKGNYDYDWIPDVRIGNLKDTIMVERGTVLKIEPELSLLVKDANGDGKFNPEDYEYLWATGLGEDADVLGRGKDLNDTIWLPISEKNYTIYYTVTHKSTGMAWFGRFSLAVKGLLANGFLFLTENENKEVELDIYGHTLADEWILDKGVLARSGFPYRSGGANCVCPQKGKTNRIWIATGEATGWLDMVNFAWGERDLARSIMAMPQPVSYTFKNIQANGMNYYFMSTDGNGHLLDVYSTIYPTFAVVNNKRVEVAPFVVGSPMASAVVWDLTNKQLVINTIPTMNYNSYCEELDVETANKGKEFVYMQSIVGSKFVLILKDAVSGKYWKYRYSLPFGVPYSYPAIDANGMEEMKEMEILDGVEPEMMGVSWNDGYFYFAKGNKLYNYRSGSGIDRPVECNFTFDAPISRIQVLNNGYQQYLWVATYDSSKGDAGGTVYRLLVNSQNSQELTLDGEPITGLGKVKSISFWQ